MALFNVQLENLCWQSATVWVEAETIAEAMAMATVPFDASDVQSQMICALSRCPSRNGFPLIVTVNADPAMALSS